PARRRPLPEGGRRRRPARTPQHRPRLPRRPDRRHLLPGHGVCRRDRPAPRRQAAPPVTGRLGLRLGAPGGAGAATHTRARPVAAVVRRMMRKSPGERYQTPREVALALAPFAVASPTAGARVAVLVAADSSLTAPQSVRPSLAPDEVPTAPEEVHRSGRRIGV